MGPNLVGLALHLPWSPSSVAEGAHYFLSNIIITYSLINSQGVNRFVHLADDSDEVPKLRKKQYADFKLS